MTKIANASGTPNTSASEIIASDMPEQLTRRFDEVLAGNDASKIFQLARQWQRGEFGLPEFARIRALYERAVVLGHVASTYNLALMYKRGECDSDSEKARETARDLYERAVAQGHTDAMVNLALMYLRGECGPQDPLKAFELLERAALKENAGALYNLGLMYKRGELGAVDLEKARVYFERAAEKDNPRAMFSLGLMYSRDKANKPLLEKAKVYYERAAKENHTPSMYNLAVMYERGSLGKRDILNAVYWYEKAAELNDVKAIFQLAKLHKGCKFSGASAQKATELFAAAAALGHSEAASFLPNPMIAGVLRSLEMAGIGEVFSEKTAIALENLEETFFTLRGKHLIKGATRLAHFTTWSAIESLLSLKLESEGRNCLRQYLVDYMNDPSEGRRLLDFGMNDDEAEFPAACSASQLLRQLFDAHYFGSFARHNSTAHLLPSVFTVSLTKESDRLDLWRAYGRDGEGYCLVLPIEDRGQSAVHVRNRESSMVFLLDQQALEEDEAEAQLPEDVLVEPPLLYWIKYTDDDVVAVLEELSAPLGAVLELKGEVSSGIWSEIASCATAILIELLYLFKDEQYSTEKEARAMTVMRLDNPKVKLDERTPGCLYCETPPFLFGAQDSEVILGPKVEKPTAALWNIRYRLTQLRFDGNTVVKRSKVPYR